jgi:hypothetical protein
MSTDRFFLDTAFVQALLNRRDQYQAQARAFLPRLRNAREIWVTEAVLVEIGNALSSLDRLAAVRFIEECYKTPNIHVVSIDTQLLTRALRLYQDRPDKGWGLTDCISFVVMEEQGLRAAMTTDDHFRQAGFQVLMQDM